MAPNVPHAPVTDEAQGPQKATVEYVAFFLTTRGRAARISCSFQFLIKFLMVFQFLIDYNAPSIK